MVSQDQSSFVSSSVASWNDRSHPIYHTVRLCALPDRSSRCKLDYTNESTTSLSTQCRFHPSQNSFSSPELCNHILISMRMVANQGAVRTIWKGHPLGRTFQLGFRSSLVRHHVPPPDHFVRGGKQIQRRAVGSNTKGSFNCARRSRTELIHPVTWSPLLTPAKG